MGSIGAISGTSTYQPVSKAQAAAPPQPRRESGNDHDKDEAVAAAQTAPKPSATTPHRGSVVNIAV